jgi:plastocyanin
VLRGTLTVEDVRGRTLPVPPVLVFVEDFTERFAPADTLEVHQNNKRFQPSLLLVPVGESVSFPNDDPIDHNVFSVSPVKTFDLGLFGAGKAKTVKFEKPGPVRIYCNIHPQMIADILVLPNKHHALVAADGTFTMEGVPAGTRKLRAWFARGPSIGRTVELAPGGEAVVDFRLVQTVVSESHLNKHGEAYPLKY